MTQVMPLPFSSFPLLSLPTVNHPRHEDDDVIPWITNLACVFDVNNMSLFYVFLYFI